MKFQVRKQHYQSRLMQRRGSRCRGSSESARYGSAAAPRERTDPEVLEGVGCHVGNTSASLYESELATRWIKTRSGCPRPQYHLVLSVVAVVSGSLVD